MFCTKCGAANADQAQFCMKCGAAVQTAPSAAASPLAAGISPPVAPPSTAAYIPPPPPYAGPAEMSGKAIGSLICGILFFFFPFAVVAIVLGHLSLNEIRKSAGRLAGHGIAMAGLVLGYAGVAMIPFLLIVAAIAIPNLLRSRILANEASAVANLRAINDSNAAYATAYENGYAPNLEALGGMMGESSANCDHALLIDATLASGQKSGYTFTYAAVATSEGSTPPSPRAPGKGCSTLGGGSYNVTADPISRGVTGQRSFYTDQTGTIRYSTDGPATADSTPLE